MPWEPTPLEDGDTANAASINSRLQGAQTWLRDVTRTGVRRGAFNHFHAPIMFPGPNFTPYTARGDHGQHDYEYVTFTTSLEYNAYGQDGGSDAAGNIGSGDRALIGHESQTGAYNGPEALIELDDDGLRVGMANGDRCGAILCMFNCQIVRMISNDITPNTDLQSVFCLQFQLNGAGTWYTIDDTESFESYADHIIDPGSGEDCDLDVPIATLITKELVDAVGDSSTDYVTGVRAMVTLHSPIAGDSITLERWNLSVIPLHAQDP